MKLLQNKSTGEIGCLVCLFDKAPERITVVEYIDGRRGSKVWYYDTLTELNEEWKDYEEQKEYWWINSGGGGIREAVDGVSCFDDFRKAIGNCFESYEEAEKAVEKLKAYKRLKDKGFRFTGYTDDSGDLFSCQVIRCRFDDFGKESRKDLDLLFGEEE